MLTKVNFSCGHKAEVNLSDNERKRMEKIAELELNGLCPDCRKAKWEEEDKKNNHGCVCVRISKEQYKEKYPDCKERLTGFPKEKEYTYIFLPIETLIAETFRKYIEVNNVSYDDMINKVGAKFAEMYPELYNKLQPVSLDEDTSGPALIETEPMPEAAPAPAPVPVSDPISAPAFIPVEAEVINNDEMTSDDIDDLFNTDIDGLEEPFAVPVPIQLEEIPEPNKVDINDGFDVSAFLNSNKKEEAPAPIPVPAPIAVSVPVTEAKEENVITFEDELNSFLYDVDEVPASETAIPSNTAASDDTSSDTFDVEDEFDQILKGLI